MDKIVIDPRARIVYASYYISGFYELYGKKQVSFSIKPFKDLNQKGDLEAFDQYFAFVLMKEGIIHRRVIIDYRDKTTINMNAYNWCDVYGKVNIKKKEVELYDKISVIGPNFGIKIWPTYLSFWYLLVNYLKSINYFDVSFRTFFSGYNWHNKRQRFQKYLHSKSKNDYVFFISSLYSNDVHFKNTNKYRAYFVKTCMESNVMFEGGLYSKSSEIIDEEYAGLIAKTYISNINYLNNIKKSSFVFNTPAVHYCLGWKLGEFLALGKAIISTDIGNELPVELEHGVNIHIIRNLDEMKDAIDILLKDDTYRQRLEKGAEQYFNNYIVPNCVINKLLI